MFYGQAQPQLNLLGVIGAIAAARKNACRAALSHGRWLGSPRLARRKAQRLRPVLGKPRAFMALAMLWPV